MSGSSHLEQSAPGDRSGASAQGEGTAIDAAHANTRSLVKPLVRAQMKGKNRFSDDCWGRTGG